jgi:hypothetical protein
VARLLPALLALLVALPALAQPAATAAPAAPAAPKLAAALGAAPPEASWAGQLDLLSRWLEQQRKGTRCAERCFTLDRLRITGKVGEGPLRFELTGSVLADGPVAVPLFGPPGHLRLEGVTEDGKEAILGFEGDHYFVHTAARRFLLKGSLWLDGDLALTLPGPLNTLESDVTAGAAVEGPRLTGLTGATVHFTREGAAQPLGPTVFQLARAVRVGREIGFEYRLVMRSGADLGVVRLPLPFGEKVLDVTGAAGWRVEGRELVLPTSGRTAEMTVTGTIAGVGTFAPDSRSAYEWWLLESDPEHRVKVSGDARQVDSAESPIARTQATARLFLVQKGQHVEVAVTPLLSVDVLAAVVRQHHRTVALTTRGDLVSDDTVSYENSGIDYLLYAPDGRPIYLATDGKAERIMHQGAEGKDMLVPLRTGSHTVRVQALAEAAVGALGGRLAVPMPSYPLTASRVAVTVGVPARAYPLALLGGDQPALAHDVGDLLAALLGFVVGFLATRIEPDAPRAGARRLRVLAGLTLAATWFASEPLYILVMVILAAATAVWVLGRVLRGVALAAAVVVVLGFIGVVGLGTFASHPSASGPASPSDYRESAAPNAPPAPSGRDTGNWLAQGAVGGVLEGVTPVALTMPSMARSLSASRELVTRDRPFRPALYYVTDWAVWPLELGWLAAVVMVLAAHRRRFAATYERVLARLRRGPTAPWPAAPPPPPEDQP